ncbi:MAG: hypothetical protein E5Y30_26675, partial [Mesorhizobium sp.]
MTLFADGRISPTNNAAERALRLFATRRSPTHYGFQLRGIEVRDRRCSGPPPLHR